MLRVVESLAHSVCVRIEEWRSTELIAQNLLWVMC
jgi:hypothetical protein